MTVLIFDQYMIKGKIIGKSYLYNHILKVTNISVGLLLRRANEK